MPGDIIKRITKKLRRAEEDISEEPEGAFLADEELIFDEEVKEESEEEEFKDNMLQRLSSLEDSTARARTAIENIRKEISEVKNEMGRIDESLREIMMLYEVVSTQVNPFIGESKVTAASMEKLESMENEVRKMRDTLDDVLVDLKLLVPREIDVHSIIMEVLQEE